MGLESKFSHIPIINFSKPNLSQGSSEWESVRSQVQKALEEYGFFQALFDKISPELQLEIFDSLKEFFGLPSEIKELNVSENPLQGYLNLQDEINSYESFSINDPMIFDKVDSLRNVLWPQGNPRFSKSVVSYGKEVVDLSKTISTMIVESLGLEKYLEEHLNSTSHFLRGIKYKAPQTNEKKDRLAAHRDVNMLTILSQNQVDGLVVRTKDGEWVNLEFKPNSFIIFAGQSLCAWTNDRVYAPYHRVVMSGNEERYSLGLFTIFKPGYLVRVPEELVDEEHPLKYEPFDYFEFIKAKSKLVETYNEEKSQGILE